MCSSLTALMPENCWERCIMRATVSCCLYTGEQIWERTKRETPSNIWAHGFAHTFKIKRHWKSLRSFMQQGMYFKWLVLLPVKRWRPWAPCPLHPSLSSSLPDQQLYHKPPLNGADLQPDVQPGQFLTSVTERTKQDAFTHFAVWKLTPSDWYHVSEHHLCWRSSLI